MKLKLIHIVAIVCTAISIGCLKSEHGSFTVRSSLDSAVFYFRSGGELAELGIYDSSTLFFKKALSYYESNQTSVKSIECLNRIGANFISLRKYDSSYTSLSSALALGIRDNLMRSSEIATTFDNFGVYYGHLDRLDSSIIYLRKGLDLRTEIFGENSYEVALSLSGLGWILTTKKDYDSALYYLKKSLSIGKNVVEIDDPLISDCYLNLAYNYAQRGDYQRGLLYMDEVLKIWDLDSLQNHPALFHIYLNTGNYHIGLGKCGEAQKWFSKILSKPFSDKVAIYHAHAYLNRARCKEDSLAMSGMRDFTKGLSILNDIYGNNGKTTASTYLAMAKAFGSANILDSAFFYINKSEQLYTKAFGKNSVQLARTFILRSELLNQKGAMSKALQSVNDAMDILTTDFSPQTSYDNPTLLEITIGKEIIDALALKGKILTGFYQSDSSNIKLLEASFDSFKLAIQVIDAIKEDYTFDRSKLLIGKDQEMVYQGAMDAIIGLHELRPKMGYDKMAFEVAEKNRANVLLSNFQEVRARKISGIPDAVLKKERQLKVDLAYVKSQILREKGEGSKAVLLEHRSHFFDLKIEYDSLINQMKKEFPKYHHLRRQSKVVQVAALQRMLKPDELVIEYFVGRDITRIFVVGIGKFHVVSVNHGGNIQSHIEGLLQAINKYQKTPFLLHAKKLYQELIEPIEKEIRGAKKLIIVPHNELALVPFDCLVADSDSLKNEEIQYLIKDFEIVHHYSATLYAQDFNVSNPTKGLIAFAPFDNFTSISEHSVLPDLPASLEEVEGIYSFRSGISGESLIFTSKEASEEKFKTQTPDFKYIHLATHNIVDKNDPEKTAFYFSQSLEKSTKNDGIMEISETYNLNLNAELVVLSSCESGIGEMVNGEGALTMTRGLYYSGAQNVLCSLWKINDELTKDFMIDFYENLFARKATISEALRSTKLKFIQSSTTTFPKHWSGFTLIGN